MKTEDTAQANLSITSWLTSMRRHLPGYFWPILSFSLICNILLLVSPLYMLQVYDRILTSGSQDTLIWITIIAVFLMFIYGMAETGRRRICSMAAEDLDAMISDKVFEGFDRNHNAGASLPNDLRVLARIRGLFQNQTILPFFDLPFAPLFLIVMFLIHPIIGFIGLAGGFILLCVAIAAELSTRNTNTVASAGNSKAFLLASGLSRQRSVIVSMGLTKNALKKWRSTKDEVRELTLKAGASENSFSSATRAGRQTLQILILGAGGALAIAQQVSPGAIVAGSIIMSRALGPIDQLVGNWRSITAARSAWKQLGETIAQDAKRDDYTPLPRPEALMELERLSVTAPGLKTALVRPFSVNFKGGQIVAVMGANGCGKTTLLQTIAGAWSPQSGAVLLGGRELHKWHAEDRGQYMGYVPQNVELLPGTVAENIARMSEASPEQIISAAQSVGAHEMILALPEGYETEITPNEAGSLSAGQRQLVGLARAFFGNPVLVTLDEPTANLDPDKAKEVIGLLKRAAEAGTIILTATHDNNLVAATRAIMLIKKGGVLTADTKKYLEAVGKSNSQPSVISPLKFTGGA